MIIKLCAIVVLSAFINSSKCENEDIKVCLPQMGCMEGIEIPGYRVKSFKAFLGIPYAQAPIGDLRFRNPMPVEPWQGLLTAKEAKPDCLQKNFLLPHWPITGSEDCLYLNIYRPCCGGQQALPVIFYIYGGGLFSGSARPSLLGPEYFMDTQKVIVVTINYRLGPFGFLSTGDSEMPGNFGLKDQYLALKWVNKHIAYFGGNPQEITLFGHSSGASSVHFHMLNRKAKDLFKTSILSSGNALAPYVAIHESPLLQLIKIANKVGIQNTEQLTTKALTQAIRTVNANDLLEAGVSLKFWFHHNLFNYRPVVENSSIDSSYIVEHPLETILRGNFTMKPWLTGLLSYGGESAAVTLNIYENATLRSELNQNFNTTMYELLDLPQTLSEEEKQKILSPLVREYMDTEHELNGRTNKGFQELFSDYYFYYPLYKTLRNYFNFAESARNPVYIYKFSYKGPYTYASLFAGGRSTHQYDNVHLDDLLYQFRQPGLFPDFESNSKDSELSKVFVDVIIEFVKHGKPLNYEQIGFCAKDDFLSEASDVICNYLEFTNEEHGYKLQTNNKFHVNRMYLWDNLSSK